MPENRYEVAGWAAIAAAALMPLAFIIAGIEEAAFECGEFERTVGLGLSDFLLLIFGGISIYVYFMLKRMLYDRYSFRKLDLIIALAIVWSVINYGGNFALELFFSITTPHAHGGPVFIMTVFWIVCIGVFGIIDVILSIILIINRKRFGTPMQVFAFLNLASGLCAMTVVLSFLALLLFPAAFVALGVAFLKPDESLEFV